MRSNVLFYFLSASPRSASQPWVQKVTVFGKVAFPINVSSIRPYEDAYIVLDLYCVQKDKSIQEEE